MSILIKGMEMPTEGTVIAVYKIDGKLYATRGFSGRLCPLVPVPPHGDLIDRREAIIDANERAYDFWNCDADVDSTVSFLNEQPTIIPAEEGDT